MSPDCARCGAPVAGRLDCPTCRTLVHTDRLKALASAADEHDRQGRRDDAVLLWRQMLQLLPPESRQHAALTTRIGQSADEQGRKVGGAATAGAIVLAASKLKTLIPMIVSLGVSFAAYWTAYGWAFAAGLLGSIWIHEMGHVIALRRHGIAASPPMFLPGVGAYVRLKQPVPDAHTDARIGLAGPVAGAIAALACWAISLTAGGLWAGIAQVGALINLFNLTPFFQLDGARAFRAMSRVERALVAITLGGALAWTSVSVLWLPLVGAVIAVMRKGAPREGDPRAATVFVSLIAILSLLATIAPPR